jgi:teichuronic acid biosynthesis glycosyltransferase TuaG
MKERNNFMKNKISVIVPFYNSANYLSQCITSVLNQTYLNTELILINDCSTDTSELIVKSFLTRNKNKIIYKKVPKNLGQGLCRNIGVNLSTGDYIAFLDSDDYWDINKLEKQFQFHINTDSLFSFSNMYVVNEENIVISKRQKIIKTKVNYNSLLINNYIPTSTVLINKSLLNQYQFPNYRTKQDYILWLNILREENIKACFLDLSLTYYRKHDNQVTKNKYKLIIHHYKILRKTQNLNLLKGVFYTLSWGFFGFYKHFINKKHI